MREEQARALGVDGDGVVEVEPRTLEGREVHDVREVVGHVGEITGGDVTHPCRHPERIDVRPSSLVTEAGDPPDLVLLHEVAGKGKSDLPRWTGDEDLLAREHGR